MSKNIHFSKRTDLRDARAVTGESMKTVYGPRKFHNNLTFFAKPAADVRKS